MPAPLLELSADRIAQECKRAAEHEEFLRNWRRAGWRLVVPWTGVYALGLVSAFASLHLMGDMARIAFWSGLMIGNGAIMGCLFTLWNREQA